MRALVVASMLLLALGGCATDSGTGYAGRERMPATYQVVDQKYMAKAMQLARLKGVEIVWVNPPKVRRERTQDE